MEENEDEKSEVCTIDLGRNSLDNDYTFFTDGTVKRLYDASNWSYNRIEWSKLTSFDENLRARFLEKCPVEYKERLEKLLVEFPEKK